MAGGADPSELDRRVFEAMPGGIVHVGADGAILSANREAARLLGLRAGRAHGNVLEWEASSELEDGRRRPASERPVATALRTGQPQPRAVVRVRGPGGDAWAAYSVAPFTSPSGEVAGAVVAILDVTKEKKAEAELRRAHELLRSILDSSPNPICTTDETGRLLFITRKDAPTGELAWANVAPEDRAEARAAFERVLAAGEPQSYECTGVSGTRWLVHAAPRHEGDRIAGVTYLARDVTEVRALEARVAVADRMASLGILAAGVTHEINNPLTYVLANLRWAERRAAADDDRELGERLAAVAEGVERIRSVVADLRAFTHATEERRTLVDVRPLLDAAVRMASSEVRHRARIVTRYDEAPLVLADEGRLGQVFLNLVVNAAQAIPEGHVDANTITLRTGTDEAGRALVEVTDTGGGIPAELQAKVFEPFVTSKPRGVGTGLGLYICRNVLASIGGEIALRSTPGTGTTFSVTIPSAPGSAPPVRAETSDARAASAGARLSVLVADDEDAIATVMRAYLAAHDVETVGTGREAIARLGARDFDVIFCDLVMPDLTGMDVYEALLGERRGRERRVVFMTGGAFTERARTFLEDVPNLVLEKPFTLAEVAEALDHAARR